YKHSVFTTTEVEYSDAPQTVHKNIQAAFDTMEAITVLGNWNHRTGGGVWFPQDKALVELVPGATVLIPAGTKPYSLVGVRPHEKQFVFRQFCNAGVLRWVKKGLRSDTEFEQGASPDELAAWEEYRVLRGRAALKKFSRLNEVYVL
ncbi:hypothetical protein C8F04DRAFT_963409, partial [Mycena alexandri]